MKKSTLNNKLLKFTLPLLVIPIFLLSLFYYQYLTHLLTNEIIELSKSTLNGESETIAFSVLDYKSLLEKKLVIVNQTFIYILFIIVFVVFISVVLTIIFSFSVTHPVRSLIEGSRRVIGGDLSYRIEVSSNDEIGELVQSFNSMTKKRREVESNLEKQNEMLNKSQKTAKLGSWKWNMVSDEIIWTDEAFRLFGEEAQSFTPTNERFLSYLEDKDRVRLDKAVAFAIENRAPYSIEYQIRHSDGKLLYIQESGNVYYDNDTPISIIGTLLDITETKNIQLKLKELKERLELALLGNNDGIWDWNVVTNEVYFSPRWKEIIGFSDDELPNEFSSWESRVHPDDLEPTMRGIQENLDGKTEYYEGVHRMKSKDGRWIWILDRGKAIFNEEGKTIRMIGTHTDVTQQKMMERELRDKKRDFQAIYEGSKEAIAILDEESNFLKVNDAYLEMTGMSEEELLSTSCIALSAPEDVKRSIEVLGKVLKSGFIKDYEKRCRLKDGTYLNVNMSISRLDNPTRLLISARDVTKQKAAEDALKEQKEILDYQAHHDALTGLPNRALFNDRLQRMIEKGKRKNSKFALLFIDLDHFKEINDSLGHDAGDEILKIVTSRLRETTRGADTVARLGGDEFTLILEDLKQNQDASLVANSILKALAKAMNVENNVLYVSSSIGISVYPDDGESAQNLLKFADSAMYKAKEEGRNNFQYYNSTMTELAFERVVMEASLREALKGEELIVYYQPQVDGVRDKLIGMEALVRWQHPTMGLISPDKFIPLAESTGLIVELDRYVMRVAMTQVSQWYEEGLNPGTLAMNLAVKQLKQQDFIETFKSLIKETRCRTEWLELEVTESRIMTNPDEAIKLLGKISDLGVELAVDDFGTGYSSLTYLKRLPIDKLKIDQDFVRDLPDDEEDVGITKAVIALAKSLNLKVIAEGVETKEQKDFIVANGCENIQGYYYSKPIPADKMKAVLLNGFGLE